MSRIPRPSRRCAARPLATGLLGPLLLAVAANAQTQPIGLAPELPSVDEALSVSVELPAGVEVTGLVVGAAKRVRIGNRSEIGGEVSTLAGPVDVGSEAKLGTTTSGGDVVLGARSRVSGDVVAVGELVTRARAVVEGTTQTGATLGEPSVVAWDATAPDATQGAISLLPGEMRDLQPGVYGALELQPGSQLVLHAGVHVFDSARIHPHARLVVEDAAGPVQIYLRGGLLFEGAVQSAYSSIPQLVLVAHGAGPVLVQSPFTGVLIAPRAEIQVAGHRDGHRALFLGDAVRIAPLAIVRPYTLEWDQVAGLDLNESPEGEAPVHEMTRSPGDIWVSVDAEGGGSPAGASGSDETVSFRLPESYPVAGGIIGNGSVSFGFRAPDGTLVTCLYQGGSSTSAPADPVELNLGRLLIFAGCSDGLPFDAPREGSGFELSVTPIPGYPVSVRSPLIADGFCSDEMELLSGDQTRRMRAAFDWSTATPIDERNPDGTFALYYAWVYIRDIEEAEALRKLYIHILQAPLFTEELAAYAGRCGTFTNPGDGEGVFIPVVIPGLTYNRLIEALSADDIEGDRVVFDAVLLRPPPAAARNPNGSIRLDVLAESRFRYLHYEPHPLPGPESLDLTGSGVTKAFVDVLTFVGEGLRDVGEAITNTLGALDRLFRDEITVTLHIHGIVRDPSFVEDRGLACVDSGQPFACCTGLGSYANTAPCSEADDPIMIRAWGPNRGRPLGARGMEVTILQQLFDLPIPTSSQGRTDLAGRVAIAAVRDGEPFGNGLCVELKSDGAFVTDFLLPVKVCDLRGFDAANPTTSDDRFELDDFSTSREIDIHTANGRLVGLYGAEDVFDYGQRVMSYAPRRARITSGFWAATFSVRDGGPFERPYTPCLGYRNSVSDALVAAASAAGGLLAALPVIGPGVGIATATFAAIIGDADMVLSMGSPVHVSRELGSHEYGHYMLCSAMQEVNPATIDFLLFGFFAGPGNLQRATRYMNEAVADYFTGQVTGGHNYGWLGDNDGNPANDVTTAQGFCNGRTPCWDRNERTHAPIESDASDVGRLATLLHDAFDGQGQDLDSDVPNDADLWRRRSSLCTAAATPFPCCTGAGTSDGSAFCEQLVLTANNEGYGNDDEALESMAIEGRFFRTFANFLALTNLPDVPEFDWFTDPRTFGALDTAMRFAGQSWCERCRVMGLHSTTDPDDNVGALFASCVGDPLLAGALGAPPEPDLRIEAATCSACPDGHTSDANGECIPCDDGVIGNECVDVVEPD